MGIEPNLKAYVLILIIMWLYSNTFESLIKFQYYILCKLLIYCNFCRIFSLVVGLLHHF